MLPVFDDSAVAKDIEAVCSKCGETWHVIVAVASGKIAEVQCKSCGGFHKYRPIAEDRMTLKRNTSTSIAAATKNGSPEALKAAESRKKGEKAPRVVKEAEPKILKPKVPHNGGATKPYNLKNTGYELGDKINHNKYGLGIVDEMPMPGKMFVTFETIRVQLVYGK